MQEKIKIRMQNKWICESLTLETCQSSQVSDVAVATRLSA